MMTLDYGELNKVAPSIHAEVPNIVTILDTLITVLEVYHALLDLASTFFSMPLAVEL